MEKDLKKQIKYLSTYCLCVLLFTCGVNAQVSILGEMTHEKNAEPGDTYSGTIIVHNGGDEIEDVKIYQTDFSFASDGSNYYGDPSTLPRSNAGWISFSPKQTTVQTREKATINYQGP